MRIDHLHASFEAGSCRLTPRRQSSTTLVRCHCDFGTDCQSKQLASIEQQHLSSA